MGLFSTSADTTSKEIESLLLPDEQVEKTVRLIEDFLVITNKRLLFIDKEITSSKREIVSIPFRCISEVSIIRNASMDFAQQISIQIGVNRRKFVMHEKGASMDIYKLLVQKTL